MVWPLAAAMAAKLSAAVQSSIAPMPLHRLPARVPAINSAAPRRRYYWFWVAAKSGGVSRAATSVSNCSSVRKTIRGRW